MTIESSLERIAIALEKLVNNSNPVKDTNAKPAPPKTENKKEEPKKETPPPPPVKSMPEEKELKSVEVPTAPEIKSPEDLNAALVNEFQRLKGNREPIDMVLRKYGAQNVSQLKPEQYDTVIKEVRSING